MKKEELKTILKPLIKECIKEVIFEDGTLSTVISEVVKGLGNPLTESRSTTPRHEKKHVRETDEQSKTRLKKMNEKKRRMLDAIGNDAYNGVNLFEGTTPTTAPTQPSHGPLSGIGSEDPGVDISSFSQSSEIWKKLAGN